LSSFQAHLRASSPNHLCRIYCIAIPDDFERKEIVYAAISSLNIPLPEIYNLSGIEVDLEKILHILNSPNLMGDQPIIFLNEPDKKLFELLVIQCLEPLVSGYLFIGLKTKPISEKMEKYGVILDLTQERPWERDKRWSLSLQEKARSLKKQFSSEASTLMIQRLDSDASLIRSEMEKLLTFCADKDLIGCDDVRAVCQENRSQTLWKLAENLIWDHTLPSIAVDPSNFSYFYGFLFALRQQLLIGDKMHALAKSCVPFSHWDIHFPKLKPQLLQQRAIAAERLGAIYFRKGLEILFDIELFSKTHSLSADIILDCIYMKLCANFVPR